MLETGLEQHARQNQLLLCRCARANEAPIQDHPRALRDGHDVVRGGVQGHLRGEVVEVDLKPVSVLW